MTRAAEERVWLAARVGSYPTVQESSMFQYSSKSYGIVSDVEFPGKQNLEQRLAWKKNLSMSAHRSNTYEKVKKRGLNKGMRWTVKQLQQRCWQNSHILKLRWLFRTAYNWGKRGQDHLLDTGWSRKECHMEGGSLQLRAILRKGFRWDPTDNTHQCRWILSPERGILIAKHNVYCITLVCTCQISDLFIPCCCCCFFFLAHLHHLT